MNEFFLLIDRNPNQKSAGIKTILDFALITEFKGILDISFSNWKFNNTKSEQEEFRSQLDLVDQLFVDKGFKAFRSSDKKSIISLMNRPGINYDHYLSI